MSKTLTLSMQEFASQDKRMWASAGTSGSEDECITLFELVDFPIASLPETPWRITVVDRNGAEVVFLSPRSISIRLEGDSVLEIFKAGLSFALRTLKAQSGGVQRVGSGIVLKEKIAPKGVKPRG